MQQGLNDRTGMARRYHWRSATVKDSVSEPHTGIVGEHQGTIMNLVDAEALEAQDAMLEIAREHPEKILNGVRSMNGRRPGISNSKFKISDSRRLEKFVRKVETQLQPEANLEAAIAHEKEMSPSLDGRSVTDARKGRFFVGRSGQRRLF